MKIIRRYPDKVQIQYGNNRVFMSYGAITKPEGTHSFNLSKISFYYIKMKLKNISILFTRGCIQSAWSPFRRCSKKRNGGEKQSRTGRC